MRFHTFGLEENPKLLLIHGVLTPWQIWNTQIEHFCKKYFVIAVALDAHEEEAASEFVSIEQEAEKIERYYMQHHGSRIDVVCGLSMGGVIAYHLWSNQRLHIQKLVMDGAPLVLSGRLLTGIMTASYISIIHKSKLRDRKTLENFKKNFLPEKYLESYLKIADHMSDVSIRNMLASVGKGIVWEKLSQSDTKVLYIHGTVGNEILSIQSAKKLQKYYPDVSIVCNKGEAHCYKAIYKPQEWIHIIEVFLE